MKKISFTADQKETLVSRHKKCRDKRECDRIKGQSRLIDSYAEGLIDKDDFETKIRQLKSKIQQINQQIEACQHHEVKQMELFLVVSRLEEFAKR